MLLGATEYFWVVLGATGCYWVLLGVTGCCWVLLGVAGVLFWCCWMLLGAGEVFLEQVAVQWNDLQTSFGFLQGVFLTGCSSRRVRHTFCLTPEFGR